MFKKCHPWVPHKEMEVLSMQTGGDPENLLMRDESRANGVQEEEVTEGRKE